MCGWGSTVLRGRRVQPRSTLAPPVQCRSAKRLGLEHVAVGPQSAAAGILETSRVFTLVVKVVRVSLSGLRVVDVVPLDHDVPLTDRTTSAS